MKSWVLRRTISSIPTTTTTPITFCSLPSQLNRFLQRCCNSRALEQGKQVHLQIIQHGIDNTPFILTKLVQFYADCDYPEYAYNLFDKLPQPNVFTWTGILAFFSRNGRYRECLQGYSDMRLMGTCPDGYVFPIILRACAQLSCLETGESIHKDVIVYGLELNLQVRNSMITMYSKCRNATCARRVFDEMDFGRNLLSWNSMISGYVSNGYEKLAVELLGTMRLAGVEPDVVTWNSLMDAYCRIGMCDEALQVFEAIAEPNIISWTTLISGFSKTGKDVTSLMIFRDMMMCGEKIVTPDLDCLSSVTASCRQLKAQRNGREVHAYGLKTQDGNLFYSSAGPALLTLYSGCGRFGAAISMLKYMDKSDIVAWNAIILAVIDLDMEKQALDSLAEMQILGIKCDQTTISTVLPICDLKSGKQVHGYVIRNNIYQETLTLNALMCMYCRCGSLDMAQFIFSNMVNKDSVSWNTMISGQAMHGRGEEALKLLQEMKSTGHKPNSVTLTSALSACTHSGLVDEGLELFHGMIGEMGVNLKVEHIACLVDMLSRAGRLDHAVDLLKQLPIKPSKEVWGTLLAASQEQNNTEAAILAGEKLLLLEPENGGNYITLANVYARSGKWQEAIRVRSMMEEKGIVKVKPVGSSWVEGGS